MMTLADVVSAPEELPWDHDLYLPKRRAWEASTPCVIVDPDLVDETKLAGFSYALGVAGVQDVIANLLLQMADPALADRLKAVQFYFEHDAFIDVHAG